MRAAPGLDPASLTPLHPDLTSMRTIPLLLVACTGTVEVEVDITYPGDSCATEEIVARPARWWSDYDIERERVCEDRDWYLIGDDGSCWELAADCGRGPAADPHFTRDPGDPPLPDVASCLVDCVD